jgi:hypothetical protein
MFAIYILNTLIIRLLIAVDCNTVVAALFCDSVIDLTLRLHFLASDERSHSCFRLKDAILRRH